MSYFNNDNDSDENQMVVYVETLTGAAFEVYVTPSETILSIKEKIQRLEGIPISQQHLIFGQHELPDNGSLYDHNISDGASMKLVLGMRGGPVNTRRVMVEDSSLRDMRELFDYRREELLEKIPNSKAVTLLIYKNGEHFNFFRVTDRGDGTLTPLSSTSSVRNEDEEFDAVERADESVKIAETISNLRHRMESVKISKKYKNTLSQPSTSQQSSSNLRRTETILPSIFTSPQPSTLLNRSSILPPVVNEQQSSSSNETRNFDAFKIAQEIIDSQSRSKPSKTSSSSYRICNQTETTSQVSDPVNRRPNIFIENITELTDSNLLSQLIDRANDKGNVSRLPLANQHDCSSSSSAFRVPHKETSPPSNQISESSPNDLFSKFSATRGKSFHHRLPQIKKKPRCYVCNKRTRLSNTYNCRCNDIFCSEHRYPEMHNCPIDYKSEGKKILQSANPVVTATKLPKI